MNIPDGSFVAIINEDEWEKRGNLYMWGPNESESAFFFPQDSIDAVINAIQTSSDMDEEGLLAIITPVVKDIPKGEHPDDPDYTWSMTPKVKLINIKDLED